MNGETEELAPEIPAEEPDRRATLEAAFEEHDGADTAIVPEKPVQETPPGFAEDSPPPDSKVVKTDTPPLQEGEDKTHPIEKAPQSWRAPQKAKWDKIDPEVRQEIVRREREITKTLGESGEARQFHQQFVQAIAGPYAARINSLGVSPVAAAAELFKADYLLMTAPKVQRAQFMAKLISDYGVDIHVLDAALAGTAQTDPVESRVEQLLAQRLAPFQQYMQTQQQQVQQRDQQTAVQINQAVDAMANDPKFPHFEDVRQDMADLVEVSARRGLMLSLDDAYARAIAMNPEVSKLVATQTQAEAKRTAAQASHARAQRALGASVSVSGSPGGAPNGASVAMDRRSVIEAAFESVGR